MSASPPTRVVADTTSYLPPELTDELDVQMISLYVRLDDEQQKESELLDDLDAFYERLRVAEGAVTTSQPSVGDFIEFYGPLLAEDDREIVSVHLSAGISGTLESAGQARQQLVDQGKGGERIHLFDSRSAAGGTAMVLLAAARAAAEGLEVDEVLKRTEEARDTLKIWFAVETLEYLRRGGRIGTAGAWLGTTLKIKPILTFGVEVEPVERVRTRAKSIERLIAFSEQRHEDGFDGWVVQHIQDQDAADRMVEACTPIYGCDPLFVSEIGPVLGAHAGPGLVGTGATSRASLGLD